MSIELIKRKKGKVYKAALYKGRKKVATKTFDRKIDARQWLENKEQQMSFGYKGTIKLRDVAQQWLDFHSKLRKAPSSHAEDIRIIEKEILPRLGNLNLDDISPDDIEIFIAKAAKTGRKAATINRHLQCFRAILNYSIKKRYVVYNAVAIVGLLPELDTDFDFLSFEEAELFLKHADRKYQREMRWVYRLYLVALNCGMRWSEIAALKWDKVDFHLNRIKIARSFCNSSGQIRETTKGRKIRLVGITSTLLPELQAHYHESKDRAGLIFPSSGGMPQYVATFKRDHFDKDMKEAGIRKIRFHDLRHTFASHFVMKGGNIYDLQKLLGHSNITTTERYAHTKSHYIE